MLRLVKFFLYTIVALLVLELTLRFIGVKPFPHFNNDEYAWQLEKNYGNYVCNDDSIGIIPCPTMERVIYQSNIIPFKVTHLEDGSRYCGYLKNRKSDPILLITGDSNTHGDGVDDSSHIGYRLQKLLPHFHVINRSIFGSGNISQLQVLKNSLKSYTPTIVLATYGSYHNFRNIFGRANRKIFAIPKSKLNDFEFPYGEIEDDKLKVKLQKFEYNPTPFSDRLAICESINLVLEKSEYEQKNGDEVTLKIWETYIEICKKNKIKLCILIMTKDDFSNKMINYFKSNAIETIQIDIPNSLSFRPIDSHYNANGHIVFTSQIYKKLNEMSWLK